MSKDKQFIKFVTVDEDKYAIYQSKDDDEYTRYSYLVNPNTAEEEYKGEETKSAYFAFEAGWFDPEEKQN